MMNSKGKIDNCIFMLCSGFGKIQSVVPVIFQKSILKELETVKIIEPVTRVSEAG